jgi:hypothetical protein
MTLAVLMAGTILAAAPDAPAIGAADVVLAHRAAPSAPVQSFRPLALHATVRAPPPQPGLLVLGGAVALAGLALTAPAVTHRGCALSGRCGDGSQALAAGGLFLAGAALLAAADASTGSEAGPARFAGLTGSELRSRLGLDVPVGAPGPRRPLLRWSPFRLRRGGGVRVGLVF